MWPMAGYSHALITYCGRANMASTLKHCKTRAKNPTSLHATHARPPTASAPHARLHMPPAHPDIRSLDRITSLAPTVGDAADRKVGCRYLDVDASTALSPHQSKHQLDEAVLRHA
eukprot:1512395-Prymnesium_polylepis.1